MAVHRGPCLRVVNSSSDKKPRDDAEEKEEKEEGSRKRRRVSSTPSSKKASEEYANITNMQTLEMAVRQQGTSCVRLGSYH